MKRLIFTATILSVALTLNAQDFIDNALLFSRVRPGGSARIQAIGGAQVSLGGDYSSALANPAGLGMFNRSEFTISPGLTFVNATSSYFGKTTEDSKSVFNIPGLSLVIHQPSDAEKGFLGGSFGISLTRTNDLNLDYKYSGTNSESSIVDYFIEYAGDINPDELLFGGGYFYSLTGLAYNNYLIEDFTDGNGNFFYDSKLLFNSGVQEEISQRKGAQYQWSIAYGANFSDKFFAGASLGINTLRYKLSQAYKEYELQYPANADVALRDLNLQEEYDIKGSGINFNIGGIFRPVNFLQIGVSFTTPTYYQLTDTYTAGMQTNWNNYDYYPDITDDDNLNAVSEKFDQPLVSEYNLTTPMRLNTGAAFISRLGFISADVEFVNYARAKYESDIADDFEFENEDIRAEYRKVINYRIGGELRLKEYRLRLGYNYMPDPLEGDRNPDRSITSYSAGAGYRTKKFYVDIAAIISATNGQRVPYFISGSDPVSTQEFLYRNFIATVGFTF